MLDRKCLILWMEETAHEVPFGSRDARHRLGTTGYGGIDGCACSETVRPACRGSLRACVCRTSAFLTTSGARSPGPLLSLTRRPKASRAVVLSLLRHRDRNRQPRQTGDAGTPLAPNQRARSQHTTAGGCKDSTSGDGRQSERRAGRTGPCSPHGRPQGKVQDSRSMIGGGPG